MQEWWTYRLSDFLLFSPRTYHRMFELYHHDIWPVHLLLPAMSVGAIIAFRGNHARSRAIVALVAASWAWIAVTFHLQRYATINWAAKYFAALFLVQSLILLWYGVARGRFHVGMSTGGAKYLGVCLIIFAGVLQPVAGLLTGRTWRQVEIIGLTPDATAIATIGVLALALARVPRALLVAPILWCAIGGATLWALGSGEAWIVLLSGLCGLGLAAGYPRALQPPPVQHEERA